MAAAIPPNDSRDALHSNATQSTAACGNQAYAKFFRKNGPFPVIQRATAKRSSTPIAASGICVNRGGLFSSDLIPCDLFEAGGLLNDHADSLSNGASAARPIVF